MAITYGTLAQEVDGKIEYVYPKTTANMVEYDISQNVKEKIDSIDDALDNKVNKPLDKDGISYDGKEGEVLETNGDGTTSWVHRARVYVGSGEMPEGYDVQIDPDIEPAKIDKTLSIDGALADAKATGDSIQSHFNTLIELVNNLQSQIDELKNSK